MAKKPTYEELDQRVKELENEALERKQMEEERNRILNLSSDLICVAGMDGYWKYLNPAWEKTMGYTIEETLARPFLDLIHPEDQKKSTDEVARLASGNETIGFENRYICKDGSTRTISWRATYLPKEQMMYCIGRDITEHKQVEKMLQRSEERFKRSFENIPAVVVIYDTDLRIQYINTATKRLTGLSESDFIGKHDDEVWPPEVYERYLPTLRNSLNTREIRSIETEITLPNMGNRYLKITCVPLIDKQGKLKEILGITHDLTEERKAEREIRESEEHFRFLFEQSNVGLSLTSPKGKLSKVNQALCQILGYDADELMAKNFPEITHPDDIAESRECVRCLLAGEKEAYRLIKRYFHKDGRIVWADVNTVILRDEAGDPKHFITHIIDITERKKAETDLQTSELKYRNQAKFLDVIIENSPFAMQVMDAKGVIIRVNQALRDYLNITDDMVVGKYNILHD